MPEKSKLPPEKDIDLDAILKEVGQFGRYQILVFLYLGPAIIFTAIYNTNYVFAAAAVKYRCRVPECESTPPQFTPNGWGQFALPSSDSDCYRKAPIGSSCQAGSFSESIVRCSSWVYQNHYTIVPEYNLACEEWKRTLVGTIHNAGVFAALPVTAFTSDRFGRRIVLIGTAVLPAIVGIIRAFCNNYILYLVLEFLEALVGNGTYSTAFIIGLEIVGLNKRVLGGNILAIIFAVGQVGLAVAGYLWPYWRTLTLVIFTPSLLFVFYYLFVEESVRWLLVNGKRDEAVRIIFKMARINKVTLLPATIQRLTEPEKVLKITPTIHHQVQEPKEEIMKPKKSLFRRVLRSKTILFRLIVCSFWWVTVTLVYYGLSINSVELVGNKYINFALTCIVEVPGCLLSIATLDRFGRKSSIMTSFFICGIALLVLPTITNANVIVTLTLIGKMMISLIFNSIYIYTIELFPTEARHRLMGFCSMTGRIGSMSAPQTPLLMKYMKSLPYILFGSMAGVAGLLMLLTPETLHMKLPDTIEEAEYMKTVAGRTRKKTNMII